MTCPYVGGSDIEPREREYAPTLAQSSSRTVGKIGRYFYTIGALPEFLSAACRPIPAKIPDAPRPPVPDPRQCARTYRSPFVECLTSHPAGGKCCRWRRRPTRQSRGNE